MVDLRDALRPFVDEAAAGPRRPVAEVAERAERARCRRVRRRSAVAGLAATVAVAGGLALVGPLSAPDRAGQVSVVDTPSRPGTTRPATTSDSRPPDPTTSTAPAPRASTTAPTTAPASPTVAPGPGTVPSEDGSDGAPLLSLVDGVVVTSTTTSSWDTGFCVEIRVENTTDAAVDWEVRYRPGGGIATLWNAVAGEPEGGAVVFTGEAFNRRLAAGGWTTFGTCIDT